jgi:hypothetical protein
MGRETGTPAAGSSTSAQKPSEADHRTRFVEAFGEYLKALQQLPQEQYERLAVAHNAYLKSLCDAASQANAAGAAQALHFDYAKQWLDEASPDKRARQQQRARDAYLAYLRSVQSAWSQLDLESLDPVTLSGIGQHLHAAAWLAYAANRS